MQYVNLASVLPTVTSVNTFMHLISLGHLIGVKLGTCNRVYWSSGQTNLENIQLCQGKFKDIFKSVIIFKSTPKCVLCLVLFPLLLL